MDSDFRQTIYNYSALTSTSPWSHTIIIYSASTSLGYNYYIDIYNYYNLYIYDINKLSCHCGHNTVTLQSCTQWHSYNVMVRMCALCEGVAV